jgi:hypothetical protein
LAAYGAAGDNAVIGSTPSDAHSPLSFDKAGQRVLGLAPAGLVQLGGVEVRHPHLDPGARVRPRTDAQAVTVPHVADHASEGCARLWERGLARVSDGWSRE